MMLVPSHSGDEDESFGFGVSWYRWEVPWKLIFFGRGRLMSSSQTCRLRRSRGYRPQFGFEQFDLGRHEDMYLRSTGVFSDPLFREAFWLSVDRKALVDEVYAPLVGSTDVWNCGPVTFNEWCSGQTPFAGAFNADAAAQMLTEAGWTFDGDSYWQDVRRAA